MIVSESAASGFLGNSKNVDALRRRFTNRLAEAFEDDPVFKAGDCEVRTDPSGHDDAAQAWVYRCAV